MFGPTKDGRVVDDAELPAGQGPYPSAMLMNVPRVS